MTSEIYTHIGYKTSATVGLREQHTDILVRNPAGESFPSLISGAHSFYQPLAFDDERLAFLAAVSFTSVVSPCFGARSQTRPLSARDVLSGQR
jgi:hypothetical protein